MKLPLVSLETENTMFVSFVNHFMEKKNGEDGRKRDDACERVHEGQKEMYGRSRFPLHEIAFLTS